MVKCNNCNKETNNKKFCSLSCSVKYNNKKRTKKIYGECLNCNNILTRKNQIFCCQKCNGVYNGKQRSLKPKKTYGDCLNCNKILKYKKNTYCSNKCHKEFVRKNKINEWLNGGSLPGRVALKEYLLEINNNKCTMCGIEKWEDKPITLELEHIDGNSDNNNIENLTILCPNCHSQTPTYKNKNRGNGRHSRMIRYHKKLSY